MLIKTHLLYKFYMGEATQEQGKVMNATEAQTVRELVDFVNDYNLPKKDIVSIIPSREGYVLIYYY